jgi:magnesium transporter
MIHLHPETDLATAAWIDLVSPTEEEVERVQRATGLRAPPEHEVAEIETSSRLAYGGGVFTLTTPLLTRAEDGSAMPTPVGFVLGARALVTVRFANIPTFDEARKLCKAHDADTAEQSFLYLFEAIVDKAADALEHIGAECDTLSRGAFRERKVESGALRAMLRRIGTAADKASHVRDSLLGIGRIASFVTQPGLAGAPKVDAQRMNAIHADVVSLTDYESHLSNKLQFLLDATLGFISIEQNEIVKTLTIASVVGIPPVIVVGIYGMNFHAMPELSWPFGYPFALGLMVVTGLLPLIWFKRRGWM